MSRNSFTLIELLIVISLLFIIGASLSPFVTRTLSDVNLSTSAQNILTTLRKAQTYAMDDKENTVWGVCVNASSLYLFHTACSPGNYRETITLPATITLGGLSTITFSGYRGEPDATPTITLTSSSGTKTITVNSTGAVFLN